MCFAMCFRHVFFVTHSIQAISKIDYSEQSTSNILHQEMPLTADEESLGSPFKRALFWPENKPDVTRKKKSVHKIPSVSTSSEWKKYFKKKQDEKEQNETAKLEKKLARELQREKKITSVKKEITKRPRH